MSPSPRIRLVLHQRACTWFFQDEAHPTWTPFLRSAHEPERSPRRPLVYWTAAGCPEGRGLVARRARRWGQTLRGVDAVLADALSKRPETPLEVSFDQLMLRHGAGQPPSLCGRPSAGPRSLAPPPQLQLVHGDRPALKESLALTANGVVWKASHQVVPHFQTDPWLRPKALLEQPEAWSELTFARSPDRLAVWGRFRGRPTSTSLNPLHPIPPALLARARPALLLTSCTHVYRGSGWVAVVGYVTLDGQLRLDAIYRRSALHSAYRQTRTSLRCSVVGKNHHVSKGRILEALRRVIKAATVLRGQPQLICLDTTEIDAVLTAYGSIRVSAP